MSRLGHEAGGRAIWGGRGSFPGFVTKQDKPTAAVASIEDAAACDERADALVSGLLTRVMRRRGTVATALDYVRSLARDARANCWELAERAGHGLPYRMQGLLGRSRWRWEDLRELLPGLAQDVLAGDPGDGIGPGLAIDETADLRKGKATACVAPQHAGVTGKIENCVTWVFSALVTASGQAWVDFDAYMPDCWAKDPAPQEKSGDPGGLAFATKPELAIEQVKRLVAGGLRVLWAAADEVYGRSGELRAALRGLGLSYVVIIPCDYHVTFARNKVTRADQAVCDAVFEMRSCRERHEKPPLRGLGAHRHGRPARMPAHPPPAGPREEPVHVLPVLRAGGPPGDHDVFHHHRGKPLASRNYFPDRERRLRLGPVPGPHLERGQPAHRPDRPRPAAHRRRPGRPHRMPRPPRGSASSPGHRSRSGGTGREPR